MAALPGPDSSKTAETLPLHVLPVGCADPSIMLQDVPALLACLPKKGGFLTGRPLWHATLREGLRDRPGTLGASAALPIHHRPQGRTLRWTAPPLQRLTNCPLEMQSASVLQWMVCHPLSRFSWDLCAEHIGPEEWPLGDAVLKRVCERDMRVGKVWLLCPAVQPSHCHWQMHDGSQMGLRGF